MSDQELSQQLLHQRIRNRIIEYLELAASADEQREYERRAPMAHVPNEMINQWEDWVNGDDLDWYGPPIFSDDERHALRSFNSVWLAVADETPDPMPSSIELLLGTPVWARLMAEAQAALMVFEKRGRFDEEVEQRLDV